MGVFEALPSCWSCADACFWEGKDLLETRGDRGRNYQREGVVLRVRCGCVVLRQGSWPLAEAAVLPRFAARRRLDVLPSDHPSYPSPLQLIVASGS